MDKYSFRSLRNVFMYLRVLLIMSQIIGKYADNLLNGSVTSHVM